MNPLISYLFLLYENSISFDIAVKILLYGGVPTTEEIQKLNPDMDIQTAFILTIWFNICNEKLQKLGLHNDDKFISLIATLNNSLATTYDNSIQMAEAISRLYKSESYRLN